MVCLAAPVWDHTGHVVAAVGITTLTMFHTHASMVKACAEPVLAACQRISRTLGYLGLSAERAGPSVQRKTSRPTSANRKPRAP